jgi:signal transduction histidine kinase
MADLKFSIEEQVKLEEQNKFLAEVTRELKNTLGDMRGEYLDDLLKELVKIAQRHRREFDRAEELVNRIIEDEIKNSRLVS